MTKFSTNSKIYAFATENLKYLSSISLQGKKVLIVGASYDGALNCALFGAKEVDNFDININSMYYCNLKYEAIKRLDYVNFLNFFMRTPASFDVKTYSLLKPYLLPEAKAFFDSLYSRFSSEPNFLDKNSLAPVTPGEALRESEIFNLEHDTLNQKVNNNPYLQSEASYLSLQTALKNLKFSWLDCDVLSLSQKLLSLPSSPTSPTPAQPSISPPSFKTYDLICLSNIAEYSHHLFPSLDSVEDINPNFHAQQFKLKVIEPLLNHLNIGGSIMLGYTFASDSLPSVARNCFASSILRRQLYANIDGFEFYEISLKSALIKPLIKSAKSPKLEILDCASILNRVR